MKRIAIISAFLLVFAFIPSILAQEEEQEQRQWDTQTQQDTERQDRSRTQDTQGQDHSRTEGATAQETSTFTGELLELDTADKQITVKNSQGAEMEFEYNEQTQITGADQNVAGLFSEGGMKLTVTYREEEGFMGGNIATRIQVEEGDSRGLQTSPGQDQGSQRYGQTQDQTTQEQDRTRTQHDQGTWAQDREQSASQAQDREWSRTQERDPTAHAQDRTTTERQDQAGQRTQEYGSQQTSSFRGELVDVDTTQQKLTVRNSQGEEMEFSYSQQTEVSGADQSVAGLATKSGSMITIEYSEQGEGASKQKTAQKIHVEQERQSQQDR